MMGDCCQLPFFSLNNAQLLQQLTSNTLEGFTIDQLKSKRFCQFSEFQDRSVTCETETNLSSSLGLAKIESDYYFPDNLPDVLHDINEPLFKIMCMNINSIPQKYENFLEEFEKLLCSNIDVFGFCETKLNSDIEHLYELPNYHMFNNNVSRNKGGVTLYIHSQHKAIVRHDLTILTTHTETLFVEISKKQGNLLIGIIYRRPHTSMDDFLNYMNETLSTVQKETKKVYLMGDFNLDLL